MVNLGYKDNRGLNGRVNSLTAVTPQTQYIPQGQRTSTENLGSKVNAPRPSGLFFYHTEQEAIGAYVASTGGQGGIVVTPNPQRLQTQYGVNGGNTVYDLGRGRGYDTIKIFSAMREGIDRGGVVLVHDLQKILEPAWLDEKGVLVQVARWFDLPNHFVKAQLAGKSPLVIVSISEKLHPKIANAIKSNQKYTVPQ